MFFLISAITGLKKDFFSMTLLIWHEVLLSSGIFGRSVIPPRLRDADFPSDGTACGQKPDRDRHARPELHPLAPKVCFEEVLIIGATSGMGAMRTIFEHA
jgi:hypothetical protein